MTYGVRTWGAGGALEMDTDSFTYQVLHNQLYQLSPRGVVVADVPGFDPDKCVATILPTSTYSGGYATEAMPYMLVSPGQVQVLSKHPREPETYVYSVIEFRLLVMRYAN